MFIKHPILVLALCLLTCSCTRQQALQQRASSHPVAVDASKVGTYPALTKSGAGFFYDEVLEYRVWIQPDGDDYFRAFATYEEAKDFAQHTKGAEDPLVLVLQHEHVDEPKPGVYEHIKGDRITEWQVEWLEKSKRGQNSIPEFLREKAKTGAQQIMDGNRPSTPQSQP